MRKILLSDCMKVNQGVILVKIGQDGEVSRFQPVLHQMHLLLGLERVSDDDQGASGASPKSSYNLFLRISPLFLLLTIAYCLHGIIWSAVIRPLRDPGIPGIFLES